MIMAKKPELSLEEQIELHNRRAILDRVAKKLSEGRELTAQERRAYLKSQTEKKREAAIDYLKNISKGEFLELFGGSRAVWLNWRDNYGMPGFPRDKHSVDLFAIVKWLRNSFAESTRGGVYRGAGTKSKGDKYEEERKRLAAEKAQLEVNRLKGKLLSLDEVERDFVAWSGELRAAIENLPPECQRSLDETLDRIELAYEHRYSRPDASTAEDTSTGDSPQNSPDA